MLTKLSAKANRQVKELPTHRKNLHSLDYTQSSNVETAEG